VNLLSIRAVIDEYNQALAFVERVLGDADQRVVLREDSTGEVRCGKVVVDLPEGLGVRCGEGEGGVRKVLLNRDREEENLALAPGMTGEGGVAIRLAA